MRDIITYAETTHNLVLRAGEHCTYCRALDRCPAVRADGNTITTANPSAVLTRENAAEMYDKAKIVTKACKALQDEIKAVVLAADQAGEPVDGFKVTEKQGTRNVTDVQKAYEQVQHLMSVEDFMAHCTLGLSGAAKAFGRKAKAKGVAKTIKEGEELWYSLLTPVLKKSSPSFVIGRQ
jgi:hypothetical protein